ILESSLAVGRGGGCRPRPGSRALHRTLDLREYASSMACGAADRHIRHVVSVLRARDHLRAAPWNWLEPTAWSLDLDSPDRASDDLAARGTRYCSGYGIRRAR